MNNINLPNEKFQYAFAAHEEARKAAIDANHGYRSKLKFYENASILNKWRELMVNAPIMLHNILFTLFFLADIIISWELIRAILDVLSPMEDPWRTFAITVFCLLLNAWAAVTAHFIGRGWSKEVHDWERWNYIFIKNRSQSPANLVGDEMHRQKIGARRWAIFSTILLLAMVAGTIYLRIVTQVSAGNDEGELSDGDPASSMDNINLILSFIPLIVLIGEILTGGYLWYSIRSIQKQFSISRAKRKFLRLKESAGRHDQLAVQYSEAAQQNNEIIHITGDLERSQLRFKYRSQQTDDFLDPLDSFKRIGFNVKYQGNGKPVANAAIFGVLPNGAKTGNYKTDDDGRVVIPMNNGQDQLVSVSVQNKEYLGPFQTHGEHYIDLPEYVSMNGIG
jgi:hypothetical protein